MELSAARIKKMAAEVATIFEHDKSFDNLRNCIIKHAMWQQALQDAGHTAKLWSGTTMYQSHKMFGITTGSKLTTFLPDVARARGYTSRKQANDAGLAEVTCLANKTSMAGENDLLGHVACMVMVQGVVYLVDLASNQFYRKGLIECERPMVIRTDCSSFAEVEKTAVHTSKKRKFGCFYFYEELDRLNEMRNRFLMGDAGSNLNPYLNKGLFEQVTNAVRR